MLGALGHPAMGSSAPQGAFRAVAGWIGKYYTRGAPGPYLCEGMEGEVCDHPPKEERAAAVRSGSVAAQGAVCVSTARKLRPHPSRSTAISHFVRF